MITREHSKTYLKIRNEEGTKAAGVYAQSVFKPFGWALEDNPTNEEYSAAWEAIKRDYEVQHRAELAAIEERATLKKAEEKKAAAEKKKSQASIKKTCDALLCKHGMRLIDREASFLNNIKTKRKLTEKQEKWLRDIAKKFDHEISGDFQRKASSNVQRVSNCQHEDLGSLGYTHGTTVVCPFCGQLAEVW